MIAQNFGHIRTASRIFALQALYEVDVTPHSADESAQWLNEEAGLSGEALSFALDLIRGVQDNLQYIDKLIKRFAPAWPVSSLPVVDRNILRLALYELIFENDMPPKAAINEAVELGKAFGSESSARFVNGVLGTVMESLQSDPQLAQQHQ